jgi:hypothetical protein
METELLKTVGQIAGIGGLSLGAFLILFREIIRKSIFPMLTKERAYRLLRLTAFFVWTVALVGIGAWTWTKMPPESQLPSSSSVEAHRGFATGRDMAIEGSTINITAPSSGKDAGSELKED